MLVRQKPGAFKRFNKSKEREKETVFVLNLKSKYDQI